MNQLRVLMVLCLFVFISCKNEKKDHAEFKLPSDSEIHDIVNAVLCDSILKEPGWSDYWLSGELENLEVTIVDKGLPPVPYPGKWYINRSDHKFFSEEDFDYLVFQSDSIGHRYVSSKLKCEIKIGKKEELIKKIRDMPHFSLTIPLFSKDGKKAYVEFTQNCYGFCGHADALYLEKIKNKWLIVKRRMLWIS